MALASKDNCLKLINQLLNRNRLTYSTTGGTGANKIGAYAFDDEITDALLRADGLVITECYFQTEMPLRNRFLTASGTLADGDKIPEFTGLIGKCEYSNDDVPATQTTAATNVSTTGTRTRITITAHTFRTGQRVRMTSSSSLPTTTTGTISGIDLYVIVTGTNTIALSFTPDGPMIQWLTAGSGTLTLTGQTDWKPSIEQLSKDDVTGATQFGGYIGENVFAGLHHFGDGYVFHSSKSFRMYYPSYTRTTAMQILEQHESLAINWAMELLYKENAVAAFDWYRTIRQELAAAVMQGAMRLKAPQPLPADLRG